MVLTLTVSLLSTSIFAQKNVVWKKVGSRKRAEQYLSGAREIKNKNIFGKDKKNSEALMIFKGAIIKKYGISEDDPYFNIGSETSEDKKGVGGGTNQNYIVSMRREDVYDPNAFRDGDYDKAKQPVSSSVVDGDDANNYEQRKFRCYEYTIGNVEEGRSDFKKESQCFLIQANGYVSGEDPDVHNHDSKVNEVKTNTLTNGCLKIAKCSPRGLKVKQRSGGRATMEEGEKQSLWERIFKPNKSKKRSKSSGKFYQKDSNMEIQSCVGGCSEGFRLVRVKYALDGEEAPIREKIAEYCQNLASDRYDLKQEEKVSYFKPFSDAYSSQMGTVEGYSEEHDKNAASEHYIFVNQCVKEEGEDAFSPDSSSKRRKRKKSSNEKYKPNSSSSKKSRAGYGKLADNLVNNGNIIISVQDASGSKGTVLNQGGPTNSGWINGGGAINMIPGYASMPLVYSGGMAQPSIIIINPGMMSAGMGMIQGGGVLPLGGFQMMNGNLMNNGIINYNNQGQLVYQQGENQKPVDVQVDNGETTHPLGIPPQCIREELVDQGQVACRVQKEYTDVIPTGESLKEIYQQLCEQASDDDFEETRISLQSQCIEVFREQTSRSLAMNDHQQTGADIHERERFYRGADVSVGEVKIETAPLNSAVVKCVDKTPVVARSSYNGEDNEWGVESKYEFISLDPNDEDNKKNFSESELKQLEKFYNGAIKNTENGISYAVEALDFKKVNSFEKLETLTKDSHLKVNFQNLYSYQVNDKGESASFDRAKQRQEVNSAMLRQRMKNRFDEMLAKQKLTSKDKRKAEDIFERIVSDNTDELEPILVGPLPYTEDAKEMKKRAEESYAHCADGKDAQAIYKCSLRAGCSAFEADSALGIPKSLRYCNDVIAMDDTEFDKWYENPNNQYSANERKPAEAVFNYFGAHIDSHRDASQVAPSGDEKMIRISCDRVKTDGGIQRKMVVSHIEYKEKDKINKLVLDEDCVREHMKDADALIKLLNGAVGSRGTASE